MCAEDCASNIAGAGLEARDKGTILPDPVCKDMQELPNASSERSRVRMILQQRHLVPDSSSSLDIFVSDDPTPPPLFTYLSHGLAYTTGSALGSTPPSVEECLEAFQVPNKAGLTAGSKAWSKHSHRSFVADPEKEVDAGKPQVKTKKTKEDRGWWGNPTGPIPSINTRALSLFWRVMNDATWRNLHWLPHQILVYEVRVREGYGMRWAKDTNASDAAASDDACVASHGWTFRGFLEPQMEGGHEVGWRHVIP